MNNSIDKAIDILEFDSSIGMVGLKMRDVVGSWASRPYKAGISGYGIMPVQQFVIKTKLFRAIDYAAYERYHFYMWNNDITASVLSAGKSVVHLKEIGILHHRFIAIKEGNDVESLIHHENERRIHEDSLTYYSRFSFLSDHSSFMLRIKKLIFRIIIKPILYFFNPNTILSLNSEDWNCLLKGSFIPSTDTIINAGKSYHLVQKIPQYFLKSNDNPYRHLVNNI